MMRHSSLAEDTSLSQEMPCRTAPAGAAAPAEVQGVPVSVSSEIEPSIIAHYFHEVRRLSLLSHEGEMTLAQQIQDGTQQWRDELLQRLLHVPLLLACRARLRRGIMPLDAVRLPEQGLAFGEMMAVLDQLQRLRCQMRHSCNNVPIVMRRRGRTCTRYVPRCTRCCNRWSGNRSFCSRPGRGLMQPWQRRLLTGGIGKRRVFSRHLATIYGPCSASGILSTVSRLVSNVPSKNSLPVISAW